MSRGNTAIAALMLVTLVGVGAVALDSARLFNVRSQVAAVEAATKDESVKRKCEVGYDYNIKEKASTKDTKATPEVQPRGGSKCETSTEDGVTKAAAPNFFALDGSGRICKEGKWKCMYWYCKPEELRTKNAKGEKEAECIQIPDKDLKDPRGADVDTSTLRNKYFGQALQDKWNDPNTTPEERKAVASMAGAHPDSKSLLGAFERDTELAKENQFGKVDYASGKYEEALRKAAECKDSISGFWGFGGCTKLDEAAKDAKANLEAEQKKLKALADQSQALGDVKKVLESTPPPGGETKLPPDKSGNPPPKGDTFGGGGGGDGGGTGGGSGGGSSGGGSGGFNPSSLMPLLNSLLNNFLQKAPTCTIKASPTNVEAGKPVTLTWTSENAQSAYLSASGQVGPAGSLTVNPQQTTTYTMQVVGYPQQQQQQQANPYAGANPYGQQQGQYVWNPQLGAYVYQQAPAANPYGSPYGQQGGAPQQGQCQAQVTVGAQGSGGGSDKAKAQISCQPKIADVGMQVAISYACQNSNTSKGEGFSTDNQLSGSATAQVASPSVGSTSVTYGITCSKEGQTDSAQCTVNVNKPSIVLVANPKNIAPSATSNIGWVTGAMESCVISSPTLAQFTSENKNNTSASGVAKTPPLTQNTKFVLTCTTKAGGTKTAETTVEVQ